MKKIDIEKYSSLMGYATPQAFLMGFAIPIVVSSIVAFFVFLIFFSWLPFFVPFLIPVLGVGFVITYPYSLYEKKKININKNLHLFITYAGTICTMKIDRGTLFKRIAQKPHIFGEISSIANKVLYFAKEWNLGFAVSCRKIGKMIPSEILSDFFDRFAIIMDFGEDIDVFMVEEQEALMEDYATEYKKSLESIKMVQDVYLSLTISMAFLIAVALLLPLLMGTPVESIVQWSLLGVAMVDMMILLLVKAFIPEDTIACYLAVKNEDMKKLDRISMICIPLSIVLLLFFLILGKLPFLVNISIASAPLMIVGFLAQKEEDLIQRRDLLFPPFIRTLGSAIEVRGGGIISSMLSLRVHDFGLLNVEFINLHRRLKLGCDKEKSWQYFAGETGSHLIFHFTKIFHEAVSLGGNAEKIGEIVSNNFTKLMSLRKLRLQISSGLRGAFYGSLIGVAVTLYISAIIANTLSNMFTAPLDAAAGSDTIGSMMSSILPAVSRIDMGRMHFYIGMIIIVHSLASSYIIKLVDGGLKRSALLDLVVMLWIGAAISILIPKVINNLLPTLGLGINATG